MLPKQSPVGSRDTKSKKYCQLEAAATALPKAIGAPDLRSDLNISIATKSFSRLPRTNTRIVGDMTMLINDSLV